VGGLRQHTRLGSNSSKYPWKIAMNMAYCHNVSVCGMGAGGSVSLVNCTKAIGGMFCLAKFDCIAPLLSQSRASNACRLDGCSESVRAVRFGQSGWRHRSFRRIHCHKQPNKISMTTTCIREIITTLTCCLGWWRAPMGTSGASPHVNARFIEPMEVCSGAQGNYGHGFGYWRPSRIIQICARKRSGSTTNSPRTL
jgi:hypothetical protein